RIGDQLAGDHDGVLDELIGAAPVRQRSPYEPPPDPGIIGLGVEIDGFGSGTMAPTAGQGTGGFTPLSIRVWGKGSPSPRPSSGATERFG
ncbi:MAG TPA: hypothetical protein VF942_11600, partial [Acidimicrobiales bacterium]